MSRIPSLALSLLVVCALSTVSRASLIQYTVNMDGPSESPPNASPGTGFGTVDYDDVAHTLHVHVVFQGLLGTTTASHIHCCTATPGVSTAGVATTTPTFAGFPNGVTFGTYDNTLDLTLASSYNPSFVSANGGTTASAELALMSGAAAGKAYWNIHSTFAPGGEIRGFLTPVPEPASLALFGLGALLIIRRR